MGFGDPSIIAPFSALSLVWLLLLANPIAGDKPTRLEVTSALIISCGTVLVGISGSGEEDNAWNQDDDGDDNSPTLDDVIGGVQTYSRKWPFIIFMIVQGVFLCMCCVVVNLKPPEFWACRIAWGAVGGCLQGNVYMLKAASSMAVIDFGACMTNAVRFMWFQPPPPTHATVPLTTPPPNLQTFWLYTWVFIFIAATGLLVNALAMRYYKATFCGELIFGRMLTATICGGSVEQTTTPPTCQCVVSWGGITSLQPLRRPRFSGATSWGYRWFFTSQDWRSWLAG
mmetsp:Transcript_61462/g.168790  ORF Transcript_61462/g.168790 Transcript_61462/m.168790 type:complete len:284 (+) Transcript_61462:239-1090(+)